MISTRSGLFGPKIIGPLLLALSLAACGGGSKKHSAADDGPETDPSLEIFVTQSVTLTGVPTETLEEGEQFQVSVSAFQKNGNGLERTSVVTDMAQIIPDAPGAVTVTGSQITAVKAGKTTLVAKWDSTSSAAAELNVICSITDLSVQWPSSTLLIGATHDLAPKGLCADGTVRELPAGTVTVTSSNPTAISVDGTVLKVISASRARINISYKGTHSNAVTVAEEPFQLEGVKPVVPVSVSATAQPGNICLGDQAPKIAATLLKSDNSTENVSAAATVTFRNPSGTVASAFNIVGNWEATACSNNLCGKTIVKVEACTLTIFVKTPASWATPYIYVKNGTSEITGAQPGETLSPAGDGWYRRDLDPGQYQAIFSDGKDKKSNLITIDKTRWCELQANGDCNWLDVDPRPARAAELNIQPRGKAFRGSIDVTIAWEGDEAASCRYTIDGSDAKTNAAAPACRNRKALVSLGSALAVGESVKLNVCVTNTLATNCDTQTYTKTDKAEFSWDNASVYFVLIDRFNNGDTTNDGAYGRKRDGQDDIGTFNGGDIKGLMAKLQPEADGTSYFQKLGINAMWISSPIEQVHGWVPGGAGKFQHYAYHGYYPKDFTKMDSSLGTPAEFKAFVDLAHSQGIRIVMDVVMNHTGYYTLQDMSEDGMSSIISKDWKNATLSSYYSMINFQSPDFVKGWGPKWVRAGLPGHDMVGPDTVACPKVDNCPETANLFFLPDFKTESTEFVDLPPFLAARAAKGETNAKNLSNATVRDYMTTWLADWVETYGIDGFRVDTAKHVEVASWEMLKKKTVAALRTWKTNNPTKKLDDLDFWMTGEYWRHGPGKVAPNGIVYLHHGFDSMINFEFQYAARDNLNNFSGIEATYAKYAKLVNADSELGTLSYISSHDRGLFTGIDPPDVATNATGVRVGKKTAGANNETEKKAGTLLLLAPGAVQIFYGDETARPDGAYWDTDIPQASRSFMNWTDISSGVVTDVLTHWQKIGQFRNQHIAVGAGTHKQIASAPYTFSRVKGDDKVVVVIGATGTVNVDVSSVFADGTSLMDYYSGSKVASVVKNGKASFAAGTNGVILIAR